MFKKRQHIASSSSVTGLSGATLLVGYKNHGIKLAGAKIPCFIGSNSTTAELFFLNTLFFKSIYLAVIIVFEAPAYRVVFFSHRPFGSVLVRQLQEPWSKTRRAKIPCFINSNSTTADLFLKNRLFFKKTNLAVIIVYEAPAYRVVFFSHQPFRRVLVRRLQEAWSKTHRG